MDKLQKLIDYHSNSSFNKTPLSTVNVGLKSFFSESGLAECSDELYMEFERGVKLTPDEVLSRLTPMFQRKNDRWDLIRQIRFVENLMKGCRTEIIMFKVNGTPIAGILDGLQRSTAISAFSRDEFPILGDIYWSDLINFPSIELRRKIFITTYEFNSEREAVEFYIDMNEGITHSQDDIQRAYDWLEVLED